ncbi:MAG: triacylglycerol lipase [Chthoniobacter sp.]|jgi:triacylglycerol lipase|nr:triacylglycerol lipase [Chthoniobacter sp.]
MRAFDPGVRLLVCVIMITSGLAETPASLPRKNPVILVHGFKDSSAKMQPMARRLRAEGWTVFTPTLSPSWGQVGIEVLARQLSDFIDTNLPPGSRFDLVGFSMGGIVCRYYLQRLSGLERVERFVAISVPQRGTWMASLCPAGLLNRPGVAQLSANGPFLRDLNRDSNMLRRIQFTSMWTPLDLMILPASSSRMTIGREKLMWVAFHPLMVWQPNCIRAVAAALSASRQ